MAAGRGGHRVSARCSFKSGLMPTSNLSVVYRQQASVLGDCTAIQYWNDDSWQQLTWTEVRRQADQVAGQLIRLGVGIGDRVALLSENRVEWVIADLALLTVGAISVPLNPQTPITGLVRQLTHAGACGLIAADWKATGGLLHHLPPDCSLRFVTSFFGSASTCRLPTGPAHIRYFGWGDWLKDHTIRADVILLREREVRPGDAATIIYTSGTTSQPRGVVLTHHNFRYNATATAEAGGYSAADCVLSWLPFSHAFARTADLYVTMVSGGTVAIAANPDQVTTAAKTVMPTWMTGVPRFFEKIWQQVKPLPAQRRQGYLRELFGRRIRHLVSGGGALQNRVAEGFADCGIPLYQGYGLTEASPVISFNHADHQRIGSVGKPLPGVQVRIGADSEIRTSGPHVMAGYWRDAETTRRTIMNGWLHTGDLGRIDGDGFLYVTGRRKDVFKTSMGVSVVPGRLEALLVEDEAIDQAMVVGEQRPFVSAIIVPDFQYLHSLLCQPDKPVAAVNGCIACEAVLRAYGQRIHRRMASVGGGQRVRRFLLVNQSLTVDDGLLTPTLKVKRAAVLRHFETQLQAVYDTRTPTRPTPVGEVRQSSAVHGLGDGPAAPES